MIGIYPNEYQSPAFLNPQIMKWVKLAASDKHTSLAHHRIINSGRKCCHTGPEQEISLVQNSSEGNRYSNFFPTRRPKAGIVKTSCDEFMTKSVMGILHFHDHKFFVSHFPNTRGGCSCLKKIWITATLLPFLHQKYLFSGTAMQLFVLLW